MRVIKYVWPRMVTKEDPAVIYVFADTHFGNPGIKYDLLQKHVAQCREENAAWVHLGDWVEGITPKDKRFDIRDCDDPVEDQYNLAYDTFVPIADQCIGVLAGNHDEYIAKTYGNRLKTLAKWLDVPYIGYAGFVNLQLESFGARKSYTLFLHHGHGGGFLLGAKAINLQRLSSKFIADVYLVGHLHTYIQHIDKIIGIKSSGLRHPKFVEANRYYAMAPSYFDPYVPDNGTNYAEQRALYPQPNGCLRIEINHMYREKNQHSWGLGIEGVFE